MSVDQAQRPTFYEGQYLGAEDLSQAVDYNRFQLARHSLGGHTWGIVVGLELEEVDAPGGSGKEVRVTPGFAFDGFGRQIVVAGTVKVPADKARNAVGVTSPGSSVVRIPVWIQYQESATREPGDGFKACREGDQNSRFQEGYVIELGTRADSEQHEEIQVGGEWIDAIEARPARESDAPILCDETVPYQTFPVEDPTPLWLVPLGYVNWDSAAETFVETEEDDRREARAFRRYLGSVCEGVLAAGGLIRLRDRWTDPPSGTSSLYSECSTHGLRAGTSTTPEEETDLRYEDDRIVVEDLVWVEGNLRVIGDEKLFGGRLDLRDENGLSNDVRLYLLRAETNGLVDSSGSTSGKDLQMMIGEASEGLNRFAVGVGPLDASTPPIIPEANLKFVVKDNAMVGIGEPDPSKPLTIRAIEGSDSEELIGFEDKDGSLLWCLSLIDGGLDFADLPGGALNRLFLQSGGNIGIGTGDPEAKLDIQSVSSTSGGSSLGTDIWFRVGNGGDGGRLWVEYGSGAAPLLVLSDKDDPPRIQFQQGDDEASPDHSSWIGHSGGNSSNLSVMGGLLGVGTNDPKVALHVDGGTDVALEDDDGFLVLGSVGGLNMAFDDNEIQARNNGNASVLSLQGEGGDLRIHWHGATSSQVMVKDSGDVGLGTTGPAEKLDVRGNIKLGTSGDLWAPGGVTNLRIVVGRVNSDGTKRDGTGFSVSRSSTGVYSVIFDDAFTATPTVVNSLIESVNDDNIATIHSQSSSGFQLHTVDVTGDQDPDPQDTAFSFIAMGAR